MPYPIKLTPVFKEKIWGGKKLIKELLKEVAATAEVGESWEVACHREGICRVSNGIYKDKTFEELMLQHKKEIFGKVANRITDRFPLLVKFIDANQNLSVQVHPGDEYALKYENDLGKTEMWYVVDAEPGAKLVYGLNKGIKKEDFVDAIENNDIGSTLREIEVNKGDVLFIPAGTVHAIGKGILIAEIQQNSDTTYRVYDWDRVGFDGKPRELHIEKALDVIDFNRYIDNPKHEVLNFEECGYKRVNNVICEYFNVDIFDIHSKYDNSLNGERFEIFMCVDGNLEIEYKDGEETFTKGETILLPASIGRFNIKGNGRVIRTYI